VRICEKCGWENNEPQTNADIWCAKCNTFLGFPVESRVHERRITMQLLQDHPSVEPGGEARVGAWVRNGGDVVEKVKFTVAGEAEPWTQIEPNEVGLFPKQKGEVQVIFRPPRSWRVRSGLTPFRLVATSQSDVAVVDQADGTLDVGVFVDVNASLHPLQSAGPAGGDHRVDLENAGNSVIKVSVNVSQPGNELSFTVSPDSIDLDPGAQGQAHITVVPRETLYAAADRRHPFVVGVLAPGQSSIALQAVHLQQAAATVPSLVLSDTRLHAAPGQEVTTVVTIRNRGRGGEDNQLALLGPAGSWGRVMPPVIALPTAGEAQAKIAFVPPIVPPAPASDIPFAVRCFSQADPTRSTVAEGVLTVDPVSDITFDVQPTVVRARWSSRHVIRVENRGNATAELTPMIVNAERGLSFAMSPQLVRMPASGRESVLFKARTRRPKLLRKPTVRTFDVFFAPVTAGTRGAGASEDTKRQITFEQLSVLPRKLTVVTIIVAVIGALAAVALVILASQLHH
jgi:hypothetical protein